MIARLRPSIAIVIVAATLSATPVRAQGPPSAEPAATNERAQQPPGRFPPPGWPSPVEDTLPHTFAAADVLDISPRSGGNVHWDVNGWTGGDVNRLWFKSEGEQGLSESQRNIDGQALYGHFFGKYYDAQIGGGMQTATYQGRNVSRAQAVFGLEALWGLFPFRSDLETLLFVSHKGDVSGRVTLLRDYLITQRLVLQARGETTIAAQEVKEFTVGSGLNDVEIGFRLRYEFRREFGPYVGVNVKHLFFGTADLARAEGEDVTQSSIVFGVRVWR